MLFENLFVFEMANNHNGSFETGLEIINSIGVISRKYKIKSAVKLQYRNLPYFIHPRFRERSDFKHVKRFLDTQLNNKQYREFINAIRSEGLLVCITPFDEESVKRAVNDGVDILKIGSCSMADWSLIETIALYRKPIIVSTGGASINEIDDVVSFFIHKSCSFALMHCISQYPTSYSESQLNFIDKLSKRYPQIPIGWSGHESPDETDIVKIAIGKGALVLERHVAAQTSSAINAYSSKPPQLENWIEAALKAKAICGEKDFRYISNFEQQSLCALKRGVFANCKIKKGEKIDRENVFFAIPMHEGQLFSGDFCRERTVFVASCDYEYGEPIIEKWKPDIVNKIRTIVHTVKGLLNEAQVKINANAQIEISHHYGIDKFHEIGACLISVINRSYCKKIIVLLPGQEHPMHAHRLKEETFFLIHGDLELIVDSKKIYLKPGDIELVPVGKMHKFKSQKGAIFEEISSTHFINDSYYEDAVINRKDLLERKTVVQNW